MQNESYYEDLAKLAAREGLTLKVDETQLGFEWCWRDASGRDFWGETDTPVKAVAIVFALESVPVQTPEMLKAIMTLRLADMDLVESTK